ncbi:MAG: hypothetical protein V1821_04420, partial [bacterium]
MRNSLIGPETIDDIVHQARPIRLPSAVPPTTRHIISGTLNGKDRRIYSLVTVDSRKVWTSRLQEEAACRSADILLYHNGGRSVEIYFAPRVWAREVVRAIRVMENPAAPFLSQTTDWSELWRELDRPGAKIGPGNWEW